MIEFSILMPCLNEAKTLPICIEKAITFLKNNNLSGEVIVADNGSTDGSIDIAKKMGARVVDIKVKGYGAALRGGIEAAVGKFVIMADSDDSYDFSMLESFVDELRKGSDLVMGNRFLGGIEAGAMPALHRYLGNPVLSFIGRLFYKINVGDFHCGLRGFNRQKVMDLGLICDGMEFASEMVVKAANKGLSIVEVPTTLSPDGRDTPPHLRSWRDGWRHLRFLLLLSPRWLFLYPGLFLFFFGLLFMVLLYNGPVFLGGVGFDIHSMLYSAAILVLGSQAILMALTTRYLAVRFNLLEKSAVLERVSRYVSLEKGLITGFLVALLGIVWAIYLTSIWGGASLNPTHYMRQVIPSVVMIILGGQIFVSSFFIGALDFFLKGKA
ncbi:putative glycosyltransferase [Thalassocella blandensis]|nr:putative glycosyltransferase [Thalassocella blandensis]